MLISKCRDSSWESVTPSCWSTEEWTSEFRVDQVTVSVHHLRLGLPHQDVPRCLPDVCSRHLDLVDLAHLHVLERHQRRVNSNATCSHSVVSPVPTHRTLQDTHWRVSPSIEVVASRWRPQLQRTCLRAQGFECARILSMAVTTLRTPTCAITRRVRNTGGTRRYQLRCSEYWGIFSNKRRRWVGETRNQIKNSANVTLIFN